MPVLNPAVDGYIAKAAPFAPPILEAIRKAYHRAHPEIVEVIKWGVPHFDYKGPLGNMAAFKQHVGYGFWKSKLMDDPHGILVAGERAMGGMKVRGITELPSEKVLVSYIRQAIRLNEAGVKVARPKRDDAPVGVPEDLAAALSRSAAARTTFEAFPPGRRREYVEWIVEAKQEATRQKRLATAIEWLAEGKPRNWKYMK